MSGDSDRLLAYAIVASILAHALILLLAPRWLDPMKRKRAPESPPLVAHLVKRPPVAPAPPQVAAPEVEPRPRSTPALETQRKPASAETAQPKLAVPPSPGQVPATTVARAPAVVEAPRAAEPQPPPPPTSASSTTARVEAAPTPAPPAPASPAATDSADPGTLGQYRIAIIAAAKRYKRYPRLALDNNWEGQAEIRMVIGPEGSIVSIGIRSRSGYEVLDQQALEMIRKAKPLTPIPPALRGKSFTVDVPVVFSLKEETG